MGERLGRHRPAAQVQMRIKKGEQPTKEESVQTGGRDAPIEDRVEGFGVGGGRNRQYGVKKTRAGKKNKATPSRHVRVPGTEVPFGGKA